MTKLVLVTGGSRGIGTGLVSAFSEAGYKVAFTYRKESEKAKLIASSMNAHVEAFYLDQADPDSIFRCIDDVESTFGCGVSVLINNAAIAQEKPFPEITASDFSNMMDVNLRGPFLLAQRCIPFMLAEGFGRIINIGSIGGQWGGLNQVHYAAAKSGLINLSQSITKIYARNGIIANTISVGLVATDMTEGELKTQAGRDKVNSIPVGRLGSVEDISSAALFLASSDAEYICGQTLNLNGGMYFG